MIILTPGTYTKKQMQEMDYGTNDLPTIKNDIAIVNPIGYGISSYRISKIKAIGHYFYKIDFLE